MLSRWLAQRRSDKCWMGCRFVYLCMCSRVGEGLTNEMWLGGCVEHRWSIIYSNGPIDAGDTAPQPIGCEREPHCSRWMVIGYRHIPITKWKICARWRICVDRFSYKPPCAHQSRAGTSIVVNCWWLLILLFIYFPVSMWPVIKINLWLQVFGESLILYSNLLHPSAP